MKKDAILINTARGKLIDTVALADAFRKGRIKAIGLDVLENEKEIKRDSKILFKNINDKLLKAEKYLLRQKNVIITAHNAFNSEESLYRLLDETVENINNFTKGKVNNKCYSC